MTTQLITIEESNQIIALSTESGVKGIVEQAKEAIHNLDGGSMKTATGRKKIRSNAFKATKLKTSLKERAEELIAGIESKIAPELATIQSIKDNQKILGGDLDQLRKDVNLEVDDHEAELKRIADEEAAKEKALADEKEKDLLWDFAIAENELFDIKFAAEKAKIKAEEKAEIARLAQEKIDNDARIAAEAKLEAEQKAQQAIDDAKFAEENAKQEKLKAEAKQALLEEQAKQDQISKEWLAIENEAYRINKDIDIQIERDYLAGLAETKRLASIETERLAGVERQILAQKKLDDEAAKREANTKYLGQVHRGILKVLMDNGISETNGKTMIYLAAKNQLPQLTINY